MEARAAGYFQSYRDVCFFFLLVRKRGHIGPRDPPLPKISELGRYGSIKHCCFVEVQECNLIVC